MYVDLSFSLTGQSTIAADHGYALFGAISRIVPAVHAENGVGVHPISGRQVGNRQLMLRPWSTLTLRLGDDQIRSVLPLAGKPVRIGNASVRIGVPTVRPLVPAPALRSRLVLIKVAHVAPPFDVTEEVFKGAVRKQLDALDVSSDVVVSLGKRRTMQLKHKEIVGYEVIVNGLSAEESIAVQERGVGGKRHMGCGVFVPASTKDVIP